MQTGKPCFTLAYFITLIIVKALILLLQIEMERVKGIESWL